MTLSSTARTIAVAAFAFIVVLLFGAINSRAQTAGPTFFDCVTELDAKL
jgi:hypothetical protein